MGQSNKKQTVLPSNTATNSKQQCSNHLSSLWFGLFGLKTENWGRKAEEPIRSCLCKCWHMLPLSSWKGKASAEILSALFLSQALTPTFQMSECPWKQQQPVKASLATRKERKVTRTSTPQKSIISLYKYKESRYECCTVCSEPLYQLHGFNV